MADGESIEILLTAPAAGERKPVLYEKFSTFPRNELCSNNLADFGLKKGLDHLAVVRQKFLQITDHFAAFQAPTLNVHVDLPLLQRLALPVTVGTTRFPGIKIQNTRMIRLMEVLLHGATRLAGWRASRIHQAVLTTYALTPSRYGLNQLRYDLRKLRAHGLVERDGRRYAYRLTQKGQSRRPVRPLSPTSVRSLGSLAISPPAGPHSGPQHQARSRLSQGRQLNSPDHRITECSMKFLELLLLNTEDVRN